MSVSRPDQPLRLLPSLPLKLEIQSFTTDCRARGLCPKTLHIYTTDLRGLQDWIQCQDMADITPDHLRGYLIHLQDMGHNAGGVHQAFRVLRTFFRRLVAEEVLEKNPIARIRPPRLVNNPSVVPGSRSIWHKLFSLFSASDSASNLDSLVYLRYFLSIMSFLPVPVYGHLLCPQIRGKVSLGH